MPPNVESLRPPPEGATIAKASCVTVERMCAPQGARAETRGQEKAHPEAGTPPTLQQPRVLDRPSGVVLPQLLSLG
jgi:hypothetical protein